MSKYSYSIKHLSTGSVMISTLDGKKIVVHEEQFVDLSAAMDHYKKQLLNESSMSDIDLDTMEFLIKLIKRLIKLVMEFSNQKEIDTGF